MAVSLSIGLPQLWRMERESNPQSIALQAVPLTIPASIHRNKSVFLFLLRRNTERLHCTFLDSLSVLIDARAILKLFRLFQKSHHAIRSMVAMHPFGATEPPASTISGSAYRQLRSPYVGRLDESRLSASGQRLYPYVPGVEPGFPQF